jgi:hypothetical protein
MFDFEAGQNIDLPPAKARRTKNTTDVIRNKDLVRGVLETEDELSALHPYMDESLDGSYENLLPGERRKLDLLEHENRAWDSEYTVSAAPRGATPYFREQSQAYRDIFKGRQLAEDNWRFKLQNAKDTVFNPVYSLALRDAQRQTILNEMVGEYGFTLPESKHFLSAVQEQWEAGFKTPLTGVKLFREAGAMPGQTINSIASGKLRVGGFQGLSKEALARVPDGDLASLLRRADSRFYRTLQTKFPVTPDGGRGSLTGLIDTLYGKQTGRGYGTAKTIRTGAYGIKTAYHLLRFVADPRWHLMNLFEADILGMARSGWKTRAILGGEARGGVGIRQGMKGVKTAVKKDPALERLGRNTRTEMLAVDEITQLDNMSSGWLDPRELYGYVKQAGLAERPDITRRMLIEAIENGSPVIDDLKAQFGDDAERWVQELDDMLYDFDTKGIRQTILDEHAKLGSYADDIDNFDEFLTGLFEAHQRNYQDILHTFHGNLNRSNLERLLNSPLLWWPLSYQLKAGKWVFDLMTKQMGGARTNMLGTGFVYSILQKHELGMKNNPDYRDMFEEHPALWQTIGMMLPMTPFDMGVFMARWTRYSGSWIGAQLGIWDQDTSYPQDPANFLYRSVKLGPLFSTDIVEDIIGEFEDAAQ